MPALPYVWSCMARTTRLFPVKGSVVKSARLIRGTKEIYDPGAPHGPTATHQDQVNSDLLTSLRW